MSPAELRAMAEHRQRCKALGMAFDTPRHVLDQLEAKVSVGAALAAIPARLAAPPARTAPVTLTFPWSALVSDNDHYTAVPAGEGRAKLILTRAYREAKAKAAVTARDALGLGPDDPSVFGKQLVAAHLVLVPPRGHHVPDLLAIAKNLHDALEGVVYDNDRQIKAVSYAYAPPNIDQPHAQLTITPLD